MGIVTKPCNDARGGGITRKIIPLNRLRINNYLLNEEVMK